MRKAIYLLPFLLAETPTSASEPTAKDTDNPLSIEKRQSPIKSLTHSQNTLSLSTNSIIDTRLPSPRLSKAITTPATPSKPSKEDRPLLPVGFTEELSSCVHGINFKKEHAKKRVSSYTNAAGLLTHMLSDIKLEADDVPHLTKYFSQGKNFLLPTAVMADIFKGVETKDDVVHSLLRLGATAHNAHLLDAMNPETTKKALDDFAGDCYYFAAQWFHSALSPLFKDLNLLPNHRHFFESTYLTTIAGRKLALESALSAITLSKWALYRLQENDHRRDIINYNIEELDNQLTHFYKTHISTTPETGDLLLHGPLLGVFASHMAFYGGDATVDNLRAQLFDIYAAMVQGLLPLMKRDELVPLTVKETGETLCVRDMENILYILYRENYRKFQTQNLPEYHTLYAQFQKINSALKEQRIQSEDHMS